MDALRFRSVAALTAAACGLVWAPMLRAQETAAPRPVVTLEADRPSARLQRRGAATWDDVCAAPCRLALDPDAAYRVGGVEIRASAPFAFTGRAGSVYVGAKTVGAGRLRAGMMLGVLGVLTGAFGAYSLYESRTYVSTQSTDGTLPGRAAAERAAVVSLTLTGILFAIAIPLSLNRTTVELR